MALIEKPIFLVGSERSGTTLLRLMLDHHPSLAFNGESEYIVSQVTDDGAHPDMGRYRDFLRGDRIFQGSRFNVDESLDYPALVNDFLDQFRVRNRKTMVGATVHYGFHKLRKIWPGAKYIYLYRDGRDVADSIVRMGWAGNAYVGADWWLDAEREWEVLRGRLGKDDWIEVRFEDLVTGTAAQLARVCEFLGLPPSERMLDYVEDSTYEAPDAKSLYRWRTAMRMSDVQRLEDKLGERLSLRGYELSGHPRLRVTAIGKQWLYFQSRVRAFLFRLNRFGLMLTIQELLARRLGLREAHQDAIGRINRIINAHLK